MAYYELLKVDGINIYLTHGHIYNIDKPIPESVAIAKNNSGHSYMIYEDKCFKYKESRVKKYDEYQL